ncbi:MAG: multicopper oxidase family protein [Methylomicrobium sp.]|nr:multicopper oxidase family protein [Methylomicrobium sp.]
MRSSLSFSLPLSLCCSLCLLIAKPPHAEETLSIDNETLIEQLQQEFHGSYPETTPPSNKVQNRELVAAEAEWGILPPYQTTVWAYNGKIAPVIRINLGETLKLTLHNKLPQATSIHWHGVRLPNAMDGVPGVTQPAIEPGASFTFEFTPKDAGTFWFHPHANSPEQIERGLQGLLIVENPDEPKYSQDLAWIVDDWLLEKGARIHDRFVTGHDLMHDGRWGNVVTVNGQYRPSIPVKPGERIRIRMVNSANGRVFAPAVEDIEAQIIAVDGLPAQSPIRLQNFYLAPGNRIDLDLTIPKNAAGKTFAVLDSFGQKANTLAVLQVKDTTAVTTPTFKPIQAKRFPDWRSAIDAPVTHEFMLNAMRGGEYGITWTIDGHSSHDTIAQKLQAQRFYRLRFTNRSNRLHPMHLHGQFFQVIAVDGRPVREGFWRDTVLIGPKQSVDIGLVPIDKGLWALHCHILEHAEAGMMTTIRIQ